jgi:integral membrane protein (TIGR01906 family)
MKKEKAIKKAKAKTKSSSVNKLIYVPRSVLALFVVAIIFISPLVIIAGSKSFYLRQLGKSDCYSMISEKDCTDLSMNALNYLKSGAPLDSRYTEREQSHFADVKNILDGAKSFLLFAVIVAAFYFVFLFFRSRQEIFRVLKLAGWMAFSFMALLLLLITISFNGTFFFFHALLFPRGNWTFPFDYTIITVFPEQFFVHAAFVSFLLSLGAGLILLGVGYLGIRNPGNKK